MNDTSEMDTQLKLHRTFQILGKAVTTVKAVKYLLDRQSLDGGWTYTPIAYDQVTYYLGLLKPNDNTTCVKLKNEGDVSLIEFIVGPNDVVTLTGGDGSIDIEKATNILIEGVIVEKEAMTDIDYRDQIHTAAQIFRQGHVYKTATAMIAFADNFEFKRMGFDCMLQYKASAPKDYPFGLTITNVHHKVVLEAQLLNGEDGMYNFNDHQDFTWKDLYRFLTLPDPTPSEELIAAYEAFLLSGVLPPLIGENKPTTDQLYEIRTPDARLVVSRPFNDDVKNIDVRPMTLSAEIVVDGKPRRTVAKAILPLWRETVVYPVLVGTVSEQWLIDVLNEVTRNYGKEAELSVFDQYPIQVPAETAAVEEQPTSMYEDFANVAAEEELEPQFIDLRFIDVSDEWVQWYSKKHDTTLAHSYREGLKLMLRLQEQLDQRIAVDGPKLGVVREKDPEPELIDRETADLSREWRQWYMRTQGASEYTARRVGVETISALNARLSKTLSQGNGL